MITILLFIEMLRIQVQTLLYNRPLQTRLQKNKGWLSPLLLIQRINYQQLTCN